MIMAARRPGHAVGHERPRHTHDKRAPAIRKMAKARVLAAAVAVALLALAATAFARAASAHVSKGRANAEVLWDTYGVPHIYADNYDVLVRSRAAPRTHARTRVRAR